MTILHEVYRRLFDAFGPQNWWPGETPFEVAVGAVLTQNTNWANVEKAIQNLRKREALSSKALHEMPQDELAALIRPSGYFNVKARRLKSFVDFLMKEARGSMTRMKKMDGNELRTKLLRVNGIGEETADSILLYAFEKPVFVIDAYTKRILSRHDVIGEDRSYGDYQALFHASLKKEVPLFNEYHALFVMTGKTFCKRREPDCLKCPLHGLEYRDG